MSRRSLPELGSTYGAALATWREIELKKIGLAKWMKTAKLKGLRARICMRICLLYCPLVFVE